MRYNNLEHAEFFHQVSDEGLADLLPVAKKVAKAIGAPYYNVLQPNETEGLGVGWPTQNVSKDELAALAKDIVSKM
ncbi:Adenosine 5'-monophosphoramidase [Borealophlyctis nickersoniae]|nr:Adenosine 5'-monophosphoramidase [Borealophlyctis nickersoniae]